MPEMKTNINSHNHKINNPNSISNNRTCYCVHKAKWPLNQNCLINNINYKAVLTSANPRYKKKFNYIQAAIRKPPKII